MTEPVLSFPHVAIGISEDHQLVLRRIKQANEVDPFGIEIPLPELNADGLPVALERVGGWVLRMLAMDYATEWSRYPNLKFAFKAQPDLDLIASMIAKASTLKDKSFVPVIDRLVEELAALDPAALQDVSITVWPDIRARLQQQSAG